MARLEELSELAIDCRTDRHAWPGIRASRWVRSEAGIYRRTVECLRGCRTRKVEDVVYQSGELLRRYYLYPDDYLVDGGVSSVEVRRVAMRAAIQAMRAGSRRRSRKLSSVA